MLARGLDRSLEHSGFGGSTVILYGEIMVDIHHIFRNTRMSLNANHRLWMVMICHCWLINFNMYATLEGDGDSEG